MLVLALFTVQISKPDPKALPAPVSDDYMGDEISLFTGGLIHRRENKTRGIVANVAQRCISSRPRKPKTRSINCAS